MDKMKKEKPRLEKICNGEKEEKQRKKENKEENG